MPGADSRSALPRLAYVYHAESFAPLSIIEAAQGLCQIVWIVDGSQPEMEFTKRLLMKLGPVVEIGGRPLEQVALAVAEHSPDGVLSMHDGDLLWTARLAALLDLKFHSVEAAVNLTDKHAQRKALAAAELAVPAFTVIPAGTDTGQIAAAAEDFPYPAVLKPREGQSSRDTLPVSSHAELQTLTAELRLSGTLDREDYVLEQFVPDPSEPLGGAGFAPFVSVESIVEDGRVTNAAISSRTPFLWPFRETGYCTPTALALQTQTEVLGVAEAAAHAVGVTHACLHTEIKLTDDGPVVIEVNGRPGGGMSEMLERASGFSILRAALSLAAGVRVGLTAPPPCARVGYLLYVFPQGDVEWIDRVDGLNDLRAVDGVDEIVLVRGPGQRIDWREGSEAHVFHMTGTTRDLDELRALITATTTLVQIEGHN